MTVLDGPAVELAQSYKAMSGIKCPECLRDFAAAHPNQIFCSPVHKKAFQNRLIARGSALTPLAMAARITRGGSRGDTATGVRARQDTEKLIARWVAEDKEAGRMRMDQYIRLRISKGFTPS